MGTHTHTHMRVRARLLPLEAEHGCTAVCDRVRVCVCVWPPCMRCVQVAPRDAKAEKAMYKVTVHTSDIKFAGTDANVEIQLFGEL